MSRQITFAISLSALILLFSSSVLPAQSKADIGDITVSAAKSPDFSVGSGLKEPKGARKDWLQIDVSFTVTSRDRDDFMDSLEIRFFVLPKSAEKKYLKLYTATVKHVDVLKGEKLHSAVYLSPNSLARIYGKGKKANPRDLWVAVEIHSGEIIGGDVTDGRTSRWWQKDDAPRDASMLRPKSKTPFANLWFDSYAETRD
jgi:hypothetical protein